MNHTFRTLTVFACMAASAAGANAQFIIQHKDDAQTKVEGNVEFTADAAAGVPFGDINKITRAPLEAKRVINFDDCQLTKGLNIVSGKANYEAFGLIFNGNDYYGMYSGDFVSSKAEKDGGTSSVSLHALSVITSTGDNETGNFCAMAFNSYGSNNGEYLPGFKFAEGVTGTVLSAKINNSGNAWNRFKYGWYSYPAMTEGDWFSIIFTGYDAAGDVSGTVTVALADFRDGKSFIMDNWTEIDLTPLGQFNNVTATSDASEAISKLFGSAGWSFCIDDITLPPVK